MSQGKILENDIPVFVITFATQEMLIFRNTKTGEIVVGAENRVEQCHYAAVVTRIEEELDNELTGGWKVVEVRTTNSAFSSCEVHTIPFVDGTQVGACVPLNSSRKVHHGATTPNSSILLSPLTLLAVDYIHITP